MPKHPRSFASLSGSLLPRRSKSDVNDTETNSTAELRLIAGPKANEINSLAWSPTGHYLAVASDDCTVRIWNPEIQGTPVELLGHTESVKSIHWNPVSNLLASGSVDKSVINVGIFLLAGKYADLMDSMTGSEMCDGLPMVKMRSPAGSTNEKSGRSLPTVADPFQHGRSSYSY